MKISQKVQANKWLRTKQGLPKQQKEILPTSVEGGDTKAYQQSNAKETEKF